VKFSSLTEPLPAKQNRKVSSRNEQPPQCWTLGHEICS